MNHVIASKNLKIRFYVSSESSDLGTATAVPVAQFNESYPYLITVSQKLEHKTCTNELKRCVKKYNLKREQQGKKQKNMKKNRKKDKTKEKQEGTSYEPLIGLINSNAPFI